MSINTHIRYSLSCDKCGSIYRPYNTSENEQLASVSLLRFCAKQDGWEIHEYEGNRDCYCPDCKGKEVVK